jgi:cytochrome bd-type quinol oxidase subunit 1
MLCRPLLTYKAHTAAAFASLCKRQPPIIQLHVQEAAVTTYRGFNTRLTDQRACTLIVCALYVYLLFIIYLCNVISFHVDVHVKPPSQHHFIPAS